MSVLKPSILTFCVLTLFSCGKKSGTATVQKEVVGKPCNIRVEISGGAPDVQFYLNNVAGEKVVTIDRVVDVLDDKKDVFSISSYQGGKIKTYLKTKDSFGPKVKLKVFVNGKLWREEEGAYHPKVEGQIPFNF